MLENVYVLTALAAGFIACIAALIWMMHPGVPGAAKPRRYCPLCKSELAENETLKGLIVDTKPPQKILIRGCSKCAPASESGTW
ncbi:MAG: hypothetical protein A3G34_08920 [Candidatus Lindowbacteria bacterium RIFCSPLOWO2_12_FULL_62_27]|nr:MAG: hypothetical protein A3I06_08780 [Candidatus Lindowbacteria bacterium RIFCSPLOWO2_02_FULL_62_12]OGH60819.1 MAG: hypothetical protein A3G34_08920 [Candidatus Lindowbacteria bacterium RIFCSPLOWO2_12_FULL_62_27]